MVEGCADLTATLLLIGVMDLRAMGGSCPHDHIYSHHEIVA
jgi:hypothetical protein